MGIRPREVVRYEAVASLTITLSAGRHRALKQAAARRGTTIGAVIEESLECAGIKTADEILDLIPQAQSRSQLSEEEALDLAVTETRLARAGN